MCLCENLKIKETQQHLDNDEPTCIQSLSLNESYLSLISMSTVDFVFVYINWPFGSNILNSVPI